MTKGYQYHTEYSEFLEKHMVIQNPGYKMLKMFDTKDEAEKYIKKMEEKNRRMIAIDRKGKK